MGRTRDCCAARSVDMFAGFYRAVPCCWPRGVAIPDPNSLSGTFSLITILPLQSPQPHRPWKPTPHYSLKQIERNGEYCPPDRVLPRYGVYVRFIPLPVKGPERMDAKALKANRARAKKMKSKVTLPTSSTADTPTLQCHCKQDDTESRRRRDSEINGLPDTKSTWSSINSRARPRKNSSKSAMLYCQ
ncbi:uncharacterized protein BDV17DRAFT_274150 [Aspergillus undulatus]|uniref:uncharacterized protein n=1 Tax=Aspergillus undulatus TaxID=1810928 RepID=UPI003CCCD421